MGEPKKDTADDIKHINKRLVDISRAANRLLGDNKSKANIRKLKAFCRALNEDLGDMLKAMPAISDEDVLKHLKENSVLTDCGTKITVMTQSELRDHFEAYEQDVRPMLSRLLKAGLLWKSLFYYEADKIGTDITGETSLNLIKQSSVYVFRECDMKNSYRVNNVFYSKIK